MHNCIITMFDISILAVSIYKIELHFQISPALKLISYFCAVLIQSKFLEKSSDNEEKYLEGNPAIRRGTRCVYCTDNNLYVPDVGWKSHTSRRW